MSEWKEVSLSELGKTITGKTPSSQYPEDFGDEVPFITPSDSFEKKYISRSERYLSRLGSDRLKDKIISSDSIMVTCIGSAMGKVAKNSLPSVTNQQINSIIVNENFDSDYIYYLFKNNYAVFRNAASGSTAIPILNKTDFDNLRFKVELDLNQQRKMVSILSKIDDKIEINNQINQELEAMAKTLYDYWFVQFDFPDQNGKPYKSSGGKMVYNPELKREIPEGWGVSKVGELQIATGKRDANFGTENGKYDFWTTANSPIKADEFSFEGKAILIAGNGNFYVNFTEGKFEAYQRTYVIQSEDENMLIFMYMACLQSVEKLRKGSNGSIIKYITIGDVNNIASPYNKKVVDDFVKIYSPLINLISKNKRQNQELTQLRNWLLPMLMNGQVKVE